MQFNEKHGNPNPSLPPSPPHYYAKFIFEWLLVVPFRVSVFVDVAAAAVVAVVLMPRASCFAIQSWNKTMISIVVLAESAQI